MIVIDGTMWSNSTQRLLRAQDDVNTQAHRARLERRLLELEAEARAIKCYQNTLAPINHLPPEILSIIFFIVAEQAPNRFPSYRQGPSVDMSWLPCTTQVCRRWREVSLSCPALWSHISFTTPELTELMLLRSKDTPISVVFETGKEGYPRNTHIALAQSHRLKSIELQGNATFTSTKLTDLDDVFSHCSGPMPILESLRLRDQHGSGFKFPGSSFLNGAPVLKYLEAHGCEISSWQDLPLGKSLTTLHLETHPGAVRPTIEELHSCLERVPTLLNLNLTNLLPISFQSNPLKFGRLPPVLPRLKEMRLIDDDAPLSLFLRAFYLPPSVSLEIICYNEDRDDDLKGTIEDLIQPLTSAWDRVVRSGCRSIAVRHDDFEPRRQIYEVNFNYHDEDQVKDSDDVDLTLNIWGVPEDSEDIGFGIGIVLSCFKRWFDLSAVRSFTGDGVVLWSSTWSVLRDLAQLTDIHLEYTAIGGFIDVLAERPTHGPGSHSGDTQELLPFPGVSSLYFKDVDFHRYKPDSIMDDSFGSYNLTKASHDMVVIAPLVEGLKRYPMRKVSIERCYNFRRKHWESMQEQLSSAEIIWDGRENPELTEEMGEVEEFVEEDDENGEEGSDEVLQDEWEEDSGDSESGEEEED
ncbi:hypothetical protein D9611_001281 [Ephemerocybe angulata]|uniref:F-box domain-containing protein n=1 Tax=Ephemerocybe angulata TaxID=980116 RepID=A0A8H5FMY9_9AGAR|nr:hypothetical protein D9611_001281 [Tulosesus angulatus]